MLIRMEKWRQASGHFTQDEKDLLNAAYTGETICPRGIAVDETKLSTELVGKIKEFLQ